MLLSGVRFAFEKSGLLSTISLYEARSVKKFTYRREGKELSTTVVHFVFYSQNKSDKLTIEVIPSSFLELRLMRV